MDFDLENFLRNYKPAKLDFKPYLKLKKLRNFKLMGKKDIGVLEPGQTYIKYINVGDAFENKEYKTHVHCGGFLVNGGTYANGKFIESDERGEWTHLLLKRIPHKSSGNKYKVHVFTIKINDKHIFYKNY